MNRIIFESLFIIGYLFVFGKSDEIKSKGEPLFLTKYIESGQIDQAKERASVKHPELKNTDSYSGFLTVNKQYNANTFFWYFQSQGNPEDDPLVLWLNGGPGTSSLFGLFNEIGPFTITESGTVKMRKYSWHANHNLLYFDNPVGAGYSFTTNNLGYVSSQEEVGRDVLTALVQFFEMFPELQKNDFYIAGESYAGKYVPVVSHAIKEYNEKSKSQINLKGLAIGNGWTDAINQINNYGEALYDIGLVDSREREQVDQLGEKTRALLAQEKYLDATLVFDDLFMGFFSHAPPLFTNITGYDYYYNYLQTKQPEETKRYVNWITKPDVREAIHVGGFEFNPSSSVVKQHLKSDFHKSAAHFLTDLLDANYKVLIYCGQLDILVNCIGMENFIDKLNWAGAADYKAAQKRQWRVADDIAGYSKTAKNLNYVLVRNAGHFLPFDQPLSAWDMITRFTHNSGF